MRLIKDMTFIIGFMGLIGLYNTIDNTYSMDAEVVEINQDLITIEDTTGYLYSFYGNGFSNGDKVKVTFDAKGTISNRIDDEIKKIKKL